MFEGLFDFSIISDEFVYKVDFPYTFLDGLVYFGGVNLQKRHRPPIPVSKPGQKARLFNLILYDFFIFIGKTWPPYAVERVDKQDTRRIYLFILLLF